MQDKSLLDQCRQQVEALLGWGPSSQWSHQDFEMLSELVFQKTKVRISVSTLKRVWGRVRYDSSPNAATLNALAGFLGYPGWRDYRSKNDHPIHEFDAPLPEENVPVKKRRSPFFLRSIGVLLVVPGIAIGLFYGVWSRPSTNKIDPEKFSFSSSKVTTGLPNSVVFQYDAVAAPTDCVYIQQSWDERRRAKVSKDNHQHTSLYYWPGYFRAKLVVENQIVKEHDLFIPSDGWLPLIMTDPVPVYLEPADVISDSVMRVPLEKIVASNIHLQPAPPWTNYYNVREFDGITTEQFRFETEIKNEYAVGAAACQRTQVLIITDRGVILIPFSVKGCVSDLYLLCVDGELSGQTNDLSAFGVDFSKWVNIVCESSDSEVHIIVNDVLAYTHKIEQPPSRILGIVYRFQGTGAVRNVSLSSGEKVVLKEFESRSFP